MPTLPTIEELNHNLTYYPETGSILWCGKFKNKPAGCYNWAGYRRITVGGKTVMAHRIAWAMHHGEWPKNDIDHINGIKDDNRIENLRDVSRSLNARNRGVRVDNNSGVSGVSYSKERDRWVAYINVGSKQVTLGCFKTKEDAIKARVEAETQNGYLVQQEVA